MNRPLVVSLTAALLFGCGGEGRRGADGSDGRDAVVYVLVPKSTATPVFQYAYQGAQRAAREIGDHITVEFLGSDSGDPVEQASVIRTLIDRRVDGIAVSVVNPDTVRGPINEAVAAGIQVITFDSDCPNSDRATFYAVDDREIGRTVAEQLVRGCGGPDQMRGEVAIISGQPSAPNLQARVAGVLEVLNEDDFPALTILPTLFCDDIPQRAVQQISTTMDAHPDLRGLTFVGGWPLFAENAFESIADHNRTIIAGVDALPEALHYLEDGEVYCLVPQRFFDWGSESVRILEDLRTGAAEYPNFVPSGFDIVFANPTEEDRAQADAANDIRVLSAQEYRQQWEQWLAE